MKTANQQQLEADLRTMVDLVTRAQERLAETETDNCLAAIRLVGEAQEVGQTAVGRLSAACWQQKTRQAVNPHCPPSVVDDLASLAALFMLSICTACQAEVSSQLTAARLEQRKP
jgi:hypothetical protein